MKIVQEEDFKPITITLETREEAMALWGLVAPEPIRMVNPAGREISTKLCDWFSQTGHL